MFFIFLLAICAILLIAGMKCKGPGNWHEDFLGLSVSKGLQGFCAILIVLHHVSQQLRTDAGALSILEHVGVCFVGIFFFFSGYGLLKSLNAKENYLQGFLRKRLPVILVPFYVCILIFLLVSVLMGNQYTTGELIGYVTGWLLINSHMWYIVEIFFFYIAFFVIFKAIKNRTVAIGIITAFVALVSIGSLLLGHGSYWFQGEWWFNTSLLFPIGMIIAQYETTLVTFAKRFYIPLLAVFAIATILLEKASMYTLNTYSYWSETAVSKAYGDKFRCLFTQLPFVICFVILVCLITMKLQFKNRILSFLGSISLELYLIHNLFILQFSRYPQCQITNPFLYTIAVLGCSIILALLVHLLDQKILHLKKK